MWIRPLAEADASCGAKASGLARLIAAGLPVPDGFVLERGAFRQIAGVPSVPLAVDAQLVLEHSAFRQVAGVPSVPLAVDAQLVLERGAFRQVAGVPSVPLAVDAQLVLERGAFRQVAGVEDLAPDAIGHALAAAGERIAHAVLPGAVDREVRRRAAALGRLAVRSSASIEDGVLGSAAGVFLSVTDVAPEDVWSAVRAVWTSALTPLAVAYARRRAAAITIAVIVQRFVPGARMTVYTRPIGAPPGAALDRSLWQELWLSRDGQIERVSRSAAGARPEATLALAAEAAIDAPHGADVELVLAPTPHGTQPWIVQARPIVPPTRRRRLPPPPIVIAPLVQDGRRWTWDIAHNPDPLSPAQAGLVEQVERAQRAPYALRVCGGYLYATPRGPLQPPVAPTDRAELAARIAAIEARFVLDEPPTVAAAVERYVAFTEIWARELSPLVGAARGKLLDRLARDGHPPERLAARVASLIGPRRVLRDPVMSPAWDVAVATFAERAAADPRGRARPFGPPLAPPPEPPPELAAEVELARAAADAAERDDLWFARAQWLVRRALLACGVARGLRGDDIFWLPLDEVVTLRIPDPDDAHRRASAARAAHARAAEWDMPRVVHGQGGGSERAQAPTPDVILRGVGVDIRQPDGTIVGRHPTSRGCHSSGVDIRQPDGTIVEERTPDVILRGVGVGPRVIGRVVRLAAFGDAPPIGRGDVIVSRAITPALAMIVDGCAALVSETGGLLDHGAALARELGVTCVVGCTGAWLELIDGAMVSVDGDAGQVELM